MKVIDSLFDKHFGAVIIIWLVVVGVCLLGLFGSILSSRPGGIGETKTAYPGKYIGDNTQYIGICDANRITIRRFDERRYYEINKEVEVGQYKMIFVSVGQDGLLNYRVTGYTTIFGKKFSE